MHMDSCVCYMLAFVCTCCVHKSSIHGDSVPSYTGYKATVRLVVSGLARIKIFKGIAICTIIIY